jgi:hypothetical protein
MLIYYDARPAKQYEMNIYVKRSIIVFFTIRARLQSLETFKENNAVLNIGDHWSTMCQVVSF